jgi:hypothetical protein
VTISDEAWYDEDAGPLVRLYARVGGLAPVPRDDIELGTLIHCAPDVAVPHGLSADQQAVLRLARQPIAVPEIAVHLGLPIGPTRLLIGELREAGLVSAQRPAGDQPGPVPAVLHQLLSGLRSL